MSHKKEDVVNTLINKAKIGLETLQTGGAEQAVCAVSREVVREINATWGEFSLYRTLFNDSVSFMAIRDQKRGVLSQNKVGEDDLREGAKRCLDSAEAADPDDCWQLAPEVTEQLFEEGSLVCDEEKLLNRCQEFLDDVKERYPMICVEEMYVSHLFRESCALYSTGSVFQARRGVYAVSLMFNAQEGDKTSSFFGSDVVVATLDHPFIELGSFAGDLALVSKQVHTSALEEKFKGVMVLVPGCFGSFLDDYISTFVADSVILDGTSVWRDKLGQKVADPRFTFSLAPFHPDMVAGERHTSEGYLSEDYDLIADGILKSFRLSDYAARKTGFARSKNSVFGNFVVAPGDESIDEIIKEIDRGILVGRFSGGSPSTSGDFSGVVKNTFLIENGEVKGALSETMVSGNLAELLLNIRAISSEVVKDGSSVLPWIAFNDVIVSGK